MKQPPRKAASRHRVLGPVHIAGLLLVALLLVNSHHNASKSHAKRRGKGRKGGADSKGGGGFFGGGEGIQAAALGLLPDVSGAISSLVHHVDDVVPGLHLADFADLDSHLRHPPSPPAPPPRPQRCAVVNSRGWHLDVAAGLVWAFQEAGCITTAYLATKHTLGIEDLMSDWFNGTIRQASTILEDAAEYDVFVFATFPETHADVIHNLLYKPLNRTDQRRKEQRYLLIAHNPNKLLWRTRVRELIYRRAMQVPPMKWRYAAAMKRAGVRLAKSLPLPPMKVQLATLAPCVSSYTKKMVEEWAARSKGLTEGAARYKRKVIEVPWFSPLVPWRPSFANRTDIMHADGRIFNGSNKLQHVCIQGIIDPKRRDYKSAFEALSHPAVLRKLRQVNESLLLLGHPINPPMEIPKHLQPYVQALTSLPYKEYYDTLSRCRAILPAFASDIYMTRKSSSTVATALNVATPLLTDARIQRGYNFLDRHALFTYQPAELRWFIGNASAAVADGTEPFNTTAYIEAANATINLEADIGLTRQALEAADVALRLETEQKERLEAKRAAAEAAREAAGAPPLPPADPGTGAGSSSGSVLDDGGDEWEDEEDEEERREQQQDYTDDDDDVRKKRKRRKLIAGEPAPDPAASGNATASGSNGGSGGSSSGSRSSSSSSSPPTASGRPPAVGGSKSAGGSSQTAGSKSEPAEAGKARHLRRMLQQQQPAAVAELQLQAQQGAASMQLQQGAAVQQQAATTGSLQTSTTTAAATSSTAAIAAGSSTAASGAAAGVATAATVAAGGSSAQGTVVAAGSSGTATAATAAAGSSGTAAAAAAAPTPPLMVGMSPAEVAAARAADAAADAGKVIEEPERGTYAYAILRAFEQGASKGAHAYARKLKYDVMHHNVQLAKRFLAQTRKLSDAVAATEAAAKALLAEAPMPSEEELAALVSGAESPEPADAWELGGEDGEEGGEGGLAAVLDFGDDDQEEEEGQGGEDWEEEEQEQEEEELGQRQRQGQASLADE